jgi:hypothetical protein
MKLKLFLIIFLIEYIISERGHLVLNGGGNKPESVMKKFIEHSGGINATLIIIPTASGENDTPSYVNQTKL